MDVSVSHAARRTGIAWRCAGGLVLFAFFMQLVSGSSFWGSLFTAPLVALLMLYATLPVSLAWFAAIATTVWCIGAVTGSWPDTFRKTALAIAIGLTPHVLFLIDVNMYLGSFSRTAADLKRSTALARWYESMVVCLQDTVGDYLMPALLAGTALSVTMFLFARWVGSARFDRGWELVKEGTRFAGIVLAAATTFTVLTAARSGNWQPDPRQLVKARIAALVESKVRVHGVRAGAVRANAYLLVKESRANLLVKGNIVLTDGREHHCSILRGSLLKVVVDRGAHAAPVTITGLKSKVLEIADFWHSNLDPVTDPPVRPERIALSKQNGHAASCKPREFVVYAIRNTVTGRMYFWVNKQRTAALG